MNHDLETTLDGTVHSHKCKRCGATFKTPADKPNWVCKCPAAMGLGDFVEIFASGIAKLFGLKKCGGCEKRKKWLNSLSD